MATQFGYTEEQLAAMNLSLSPVRLTKYFAATQENGKNNLLRALKLYEYNTKLGEAFYGSLKNFEICLRNSINQAMIDDEESPGVKRGAFWFDTSYITKKGKQPLLFDDEANDIQNARDRLAQQKKIELADSIMALLSLGFWVVVTDSKYERRLWVPSKLERAFPHYEAVTGSKPSRDAIHTRLNKLRVFRNKVAHHEPVFNYNASQVLDTIFETMDWICPHTANWARAHRWLPEKPV